MIGLIDLWLAARKALAERRASRHLDLSRAWTRTARDCLDRLARRTGR